VVARCGIDGLVVKWNSSHPLSDTAQIQADGEAIPGGRSCDRCSHEHPTGRPVDGPGFLWHYGCVAPASRGPAAVSGRSGFLKLLPSLRWEIGWQLP